MWTKLVGAIFPRVADIIDQAVTDKDLALKLKAELQTKLMTLDVEQQKVASNVVIAEIQGKSWLQRNWRPILMLTVVTIIANNYIIVPYLALFGLPVAVLELPGPLYVLMTIGVGGYTVGRSFEKIKGIA